MVSICKVGNGGVCSLKEFDQINNNKKYRGRPSKRVCKIRESHL